MLFPQCSEKNSIVITVHKMHVCKFHVSKSWQLFFPPLVNQYGLKARSSPTHVVNPKRRWICKQDFCLHFQHQLLTPTTSFSTVLQLLITLHCVSKNGRTEYESKLLTKILFRRTILRLLQLGLLIKTVLTDQQTRRNLFPRFEYLYRNYIISPVKVK
jgi:hypothetical protein